MNSEKWEEHKLEEVLECLIDYRGKTPLKVASGIPLITAKIVKNGFVQEPDEYIAESDYESWMIRGLPEIGDVLLTTEAPLGEVAQLNIKRVALAQRLVTLRGKKKVLDNGFLKYFLRSDVGQARLKERETGTTVTGIKQSELRQLKIPLPRIETQRAIAATLSALDAKIEINNRINKTLEEMAQALFKRWFVDFEFPDENGQPYKSSGGEMEESELGPIPKGWKASELDQVIEIYDSQRIPLAGNVRLGRKGVYPYYGAASIMDYIDTWIFDGVYLLLAEDGSVVNANDGPVLQYAWGKFWVNNHAHVLQGKNGFSVEQLLLLLQRVNVRPYITGAVQLKINQVNLKRIPVVIPTQDICLNFNKVIEKQFAMIRDNINETNILGILRDALLPKLISGEIRVPIEEVTADV